MEGKIGSLRGTDTCYVTAASELDITTRAFWRKAGVNTTSIKDYQAT